MSSLLSTLGERFDRWFHGDEARLPEAPARLLYPAGLVQLLPWRSYDEDTGLYYNENSVGAMFELAPLTGADRETASLIAGMLAEGVPQGAAVQVWTYASPHFGRCVREWRDQRPAGEIYRDIALMRERYLFPSQSRLGAGWRSLLTSGGTYLARDYRVFVALSVPAESGREGRTSLLRLERELRALFDGLGAPSWKLAPPAFLSVVSAWLWPDRDVFPPASEWNRYGSLHEQFGNPERSWQIGKDDIVIDDFQLRCLSAVKFPDVWGQWQMLSLLGESAGDYLCPITPFLSCLNFTMLDSAKSTNRATVKAVRSVNRANSSMAKYLPELAEQAKEWRFVGERLREGQKVVQVSFGVAVWAEKGRLDEAERALRNVYRSAGWTLVRDSFIQMHSFFSLLPFLPSEGLVSDMRRLGRLKSMLTGSVANLLPLQGEWKGARSKCLLLLGRRGQPFCWDPFENREGNYNCTVVGKSGSGKSVFMQELVASLCGTGGQVVVVDDGYSFRNSCALQNGMHITFSADKAICINPFSLIDEQAYAEDAEYAASSMALINAMVRQMCKPDERTSAIENALIGDAVKSAWEHKGRQAGIADVMGALSGMRDEAGVLDPRARDLARMLSPFGEGGLFGAYFNGECTLRLNASLVVFELSEIKTRPELQVQVLMLIMFLAGERMYKSERSQNVAVIIDEAWSMLHGEGSRDFIEGMARRARKYSGLDYHGHAIGE